MKALYSFFSFIATVLIVLACGILDIICCRDVIYEGLTIISRTEYAKFFGLIFLLSIFIVVIFCVFVIIKLLYAKKQNCYILSICTASGISIIFFSMFFRSFNLVKNFYFASQEFSELVKNSLRNMFFINFTVSILFFIIIITYCIYKIRRRSKNV